MQQCAFKMLCFSAVGNYAYYNIVSDWRGESTLNRVRHPFVRFANRMRSLRRNPEARATQRIAGAAQINALNRLPLNIKPLTEHIQTRLPKKRAIRAGVFCSIAPRLNVGCCRDRARHAVINRSGTTHAKKTNTFIIKHHHGNLPFRVCALLVIRNSTPISPPPIRQQHKLIGFLAKPATHTFRQRKQHHRSTENHTFKRSVQLRPDGCSDPDKQAEPFCVPSGSNPPRISSARSCFFVCVCVVGVCPEIARNILRVSILIT